MCTTHANPNIGDSAAKNSRTAGLARFAALGVSRAGGSRADRVGPAVVNVGGTTTFELRITNPTDVTGAFSLDIQFDSAGLIFVPDLTLATQFGTRLGDPSLGEAIGLADTLVAGVLHLDEGRC